MRRVGTVSSRVNLLCNKLKKRAYNGFNCQVCVDISKCTKRPPQNERYESGWRLWKSVLGLWKGWTEAREKTSMATVRAIKLGWAAILAPICSAPAGCEGYDEGDRM